jgi:hypothetical protein
MSEGEKDEPVGSGEAPFASDARDKEADEIRQNGHIVDEEPSPPETSLQEIQRADTTSSRPEDYPQGLKLALLLLSIYLSIFLVALDRTIIATALPQITDHFKSFDDIGWVYLSFLPTCHVLSYGNVLKADKTLLPLVQCWIFAPNDGVSAVLRAAVHVLFAEVDLYKPRLRVRGWICAMRRRAHLHRVHLGTSYCWLGRRWPF